jgi:predicted DNA-binding transcriptional regulator YafY
MAWCRKRGAVRAFRTDRITAVSVTAEVPEPRPLRREDLDVPDGKLRQLSLALWPTPGRMAA